MTLRSEQVLRHVLTVFFPPVNHRSLLQPNYISSPAVPKIALILFCIFVRFMQRAIKQGFLLNRNLLLPKGMPMERPWAKFLLRIYRAEDLPSMNAGFMGSFSKMMGDKKVFIDPYVQVTFAGQQVLPL